MNEAPRPDLVLPELLQGQWTTALICTYGADLTFFETRLLSQLAQIPLRIILADNERLASTLEEASRTGQRHRLANKAYVAAPIRHRRSAHAKLILLLGPSNGLMIVGSGNLGYEGYAAPGELWHVFAYSEERPEHLHEFAAARTYIDDVVARGLVDPPVAELLQTAWGQATWVAPSTAESTAIIKNLDRPIIDQLRDAVTQPVNELIVHAPFHDADCAALHELIKSFTPKRVRLLLTEATSADPEAIALVLQDAKKAITELVQVKAEPAAYIHAKWVHLIHSESETLLTGSANLSRSALLRTADRGNIEIGVISSGIRGAFGHLYSHLQSTPVKDVSSLSISYQGGADGDFEPSTYPVVLWSRLDGTTLTLVFDEVVPDATTIDLQDHGGRVLAVSVIHFDAERVRIDLSKESMERVADGGKVQVRLEGDDDQISVTWPYHLAHLRGRLDKASQREHLPRLGDLPEQDAELYELLQELDQTLIIDRASIWRIAKPTDPVPPESGDGESGVMLEDLDWERVRRDPRYGGYFTRGRAAGLPPTDIQVILAAIAGRLGEIGVIGPSAGDGGDDDLAREGDTTSSDADEAAAVEDELEDELTRRRLPISTRTRMAFDRFVRRYAAALDDSAFIDELGPIPAATNAAVFNHLLIRLLERKAVSPSVAIESQVKTWRFLWGDSQSAGITALLDDESAEVVRDVLKDAGARVTTLRGIAASVNYVMDDASTEALRDAVRHALTDDEFGLDKDQLVETAGGPSAARRLLDVLDRAASPATTAEILEIVVSTYGIARSSAEWRNEKVLRPGGGVIKSKTFVLTAAVVDLTPDRAQEMLGRVVVAAHYAGHGGAYHRIRFEGNGKAVAFWDVGAGTGVVLIGDDVEDLESIDPPWPAWAVKIDELASDLDGHSVATG